jgi:DNA adenine methylase
LVPTEWEGRYFEPFVGSGAVFFALRPPRATLSDTNSELMSTYFALKLDPDSVIDALEFFPHDPDFYYYLRETSPRTPHAVAARFLYLNRTCWNGLYRVNKKGKFNTPFGEYSNPTICNEERIEEAADALANVNLMIGDFEAVLKNAGRGDFVYCDPPYITGHTNNGFHKYNASLFAWPDQQRLARVAIELKTKGVHVLISNADHKSVIQLYKGFKYYRVKRSSLIAADSGNRGAITEALLSSYNILDCKSEVIR